MIRPVCVALLLLGNLTAQGTTETTASRPDSVPLGLVLEEWRAPDYPLSKDWEKLGKALFFDKALSIDRTVSCASCHRPENSFAHPEPLPPGVQGKHALRHAPTLINRAFGKTQSWDGRIATLDEQVIRPISDPNEMNLPLDQALARLRADSNYAARFKALGAPAIDKSDLARALASYVRTLLSGDSVIDRFRAAEVKHVTSLEKVGLWVYESKGRCWMCHSGGNFSDEEFHNTGVGHDDKRPLLGRFKVTGVDTDRGAFKTPTLRGLAQSAPYMHDGSIATLEEVVEFYRRGGNKNPYLDPIMQPIELTDREAEALVAFMKALSRPAPKPDK